MSARDEEYMSAEELRNRLYHSLRDKGLVNSMKSQLRTSLVGELKQSVKGKLSIEDLKVPESGSLIHRASNSLVADHLRSSRYDYTLSVFLPECSMDKTKMITNEDILQLLKISPESRLFKKMTVGHPEKSRKGFLWQLLTELCALHSQSSQSTSTQTDLIKVATVSTLDEKMNVLDDLFSSRREEQYRTGATALEDRLLKFQKHLEERFKSEFKLEVSRVKEEEIAKIRREEKENFRRELDKARKDLERSYQSKFEGLVIRERNATERIQREQEMQEKEIYNQRQSILQEIEAVRQREVSIKRESEVINREKNLDSERLKAKDEELRRREHDIERKEREFSVRLENEMTKFKVEYQAKFLDRTQNIEVREATLRDHNHGKPGRPSTETIQPFDDACGMPVLQSHNQHYVQNLQSQPYMQMRHDSVSDMKKQFYKQTRIHGKPSHNLYTRDENEKRVAEDQGVLDGLKTDLRDKTARVNELETLLQEARHKEVGATKHNDFLNAKLRDMADYASIKDQNISYRTELENLKMRMAEIMQLNERERIRQEEMMRELRRPTAMPEYVERDTGRQDRAMYEHQRVAGGYRYHEQTDRNDQLLRQFETQTLQMKEMNQELVDVKQTLAYTQKALSNEVYRKPQDQESSRMVSFTGSHRSRGREIHLTDNDSDLDLSLGGQRKGRRSKSSSKTRVDRDDVYNDVDLDDLNAPKISTDFTTDESSNQSADIIAETKYRLKSLEKEATNLEKAYVDFHYQLTNPSSLPDPTRHSFRKSQQERETVSKGHRVPSPNASPIAVRPMSSTPYQKPYGGSTAEADLSTDSLHELKGSGSYHQKKASGQDPVPKFSLSDMSDDEDKLKEGERVERPRPITVDDLEARPGSPSVMVVQADPSSDGVSSPKDLYTTKQQEEPVRISQPPLAEIKPPSKLPPLSLDSVWQTPSLDTAWKSEEAKKKEEEENRLWEEKQRQKEEERKRQAEEAFEREQMELERLQKPDAHQDEEPLPAVSTEGTKAEDEIDPVMKQYMDMIQQKRSEPQKQDSEKTASQADNELSLTEEIKSDNAESEDDFNW